MSKENIGTLKFLQQRIDYYKQQGDSRAAKLLALVNRLKGFRGGKDMPFSDIDSKFVHDFSDYLHEEGLV